MESIGLRELRQNASELVRRVEEGEEIAITVAGRPSARLVKATETRWLRWDAIDDLFAGPDDQDWNADRDQVDQQMRDPWSEPWSDQG